MENTTSTEDYVSFSSTSKENNDVKVLAMSYIMYRIGKYYSILNLKKKHPCVIEILKFCISNIESYHSFLPICS